MALNGLRFGVQTAMWSLSCALQLLSLQLQRLRKERKAHVEVLIFPDEVHSFLLYRRWLEAYAAASDFFNRFLKR